jgi:hypothetical protein
MERDNKMSVDAWVALVMTFQLHAASDGTMVMKGVLRRMRKKAILVT